MEHHWIHDIPSIGNTSNKQLRITAQGQGGGCYGSTAWGFHWGIGHMKPVLTADYLDSMVLTRQRSNFHLDAPTHEPLPRC